MITFNAQWLRALGALLSLGFGTIAVQSCGGSTPEAESPMPEAPADEAVESEATEADAADGAEVAPPPPAAAPQPARAAEESSSSPAKADAEERPARIENRGQDTVVDPAALEGIVLELRQSEASLLHALQVSVPDCDGARGFRDAVCQLAERICRVAEQGPSSLAPQCEDGRQRCQASKERYAERCEP